MNRKNEVSALLSKARTAAQRGDYAGSFFNLGSALILSNQIAEAAYRKAAAFPHMWHFAPRKLGATARYSYDREQASESTQLKSTIAADRSPRAKAAPDGRSYRPDRSHTGRLQPRHIAGRVHRACHNGRL
jgi:hypothetical protein